MKCINELKKHDRVFIFDGTAPQDGLEKVTITETTTMGSVVFAAVETERWGQVKFRLDDCKYGDTHSVTPPHLCIATDIEHVDRIMSDIVSEAVNDAYHALQDAIKNSELVEIALKELKDK